MARTRVEKAGVISRRAETLGRLGLGQEARVGIVVALGQDVGVAAIAFDIAPFMNQRELAGAIVGFDAARRHHLVEMGLGVLRHLEKLARALQPDVRFEIFRPLPLARAELAAIAPGGAVAQPGCLQKRDADAALGQMQRRRQAREAAADDQGIDVERAVEPGIARALAH